MVWADMVNAFRKAAQSAGGPDQHALNCADLPTDGASLAHIAECLTQVSAAAFPYNTPVPPGWVGWVPAAKPAGVYPAFNPVTAILDMGCDLIETSPFNSQPLDPEQPVTRAGGERRVGWVLENFTDGELAILYRLLRDGRDFRTKDLAKLEGSLK